MRISFSKSVCMLEKPRVQFSGIFLFVSKPPSVWEVSPKMFLLTFHNVSRCVTCYVIILFVRSQAAELSVWEVSPQMFLLTCYVIIMVNTLIDPQALTIALD